MLLAYRVAVSVKFLTDKKPIGLYLHIPFCEKKCAYCDFFSGFTTDLQLDIYAEKLIEKINEWGGKLNRPIIDTVYLGGGTPSLLGERIIPIMNAVKSAFLLADNNEITLELNPNGETEKTLKSALKAGVNRLSIGAQSGNDKALKLLGRTHTAKQTENAVRTARSLGFENITLDLMIGLPNSNSDTLEADIDFILKLKPEHISAYILKIEENTLFYKNRENLNLPDDDSIAEQYEFMCDYLKKKGFRHYEISNFCKKDKAGRHNLKYWNGEEYLGIGPSAHSFLDGKRFYYPRDMKGFLEGNTPLLDGIGGEKQEYIMLKLRLDRGLNFKEYNEKYGEALAESFKKSAMALESQGLLTVDSEKIALTDSGMAVSNSIITYLLERL